MGEFWAALIGAAVGGAASLAAARLRVKTDERLGIQTPESIKRVARLIPA